MNATIDTPRKPHLPPGTADIAAASCVENPDWVSAHAMALAAPMMKRMAPITRNFERSGCLMLSSAADAALPES